MATGREGEDIAVSSDRNQGLCIAGMFNIAVVHVFVQSSGSFRRHSLREGGLCR